MRISLADSRTSGLKKWSDARRPAEQAVSPGTAAAEAEARSVRPTKRIGEGRE